MDKDAEEYRQGRRLMKELLPRARAEGREALDDPSAEMQMSAMMESLGLRTSEANLDALVVYEEGHGKWYGDVVLKDTPPGVPSAFGTPSSMPRATRDEAVKDAYDSLVMFFLIQERLKREGRKDSGTIPFHLYETVFHLPSEMVEDIGAAGALLAPNYSQKEAIDFFERTLSEEVKGKKFDGELFDSLPRSGQRTLLGAMSLLLFLGVFRYPLQGKGQMN